MYLKQIELYGFKSFANKTELVFEPGITAIVGPNGCGKSNCSDAIKWVLGEQSAKELRGSKMEDIIFNGTAETEPVNIAEVSLVLSNDDKTLEVDYDEVIITRRVYRSGESEYFINKTPVRLKDINDLLAGTGIGVSSYSIAEQGRIDRVINARPQDRREIFEEASGITKFKNKKNEALQKLEHTENNLNRLSDIITEVKRQISSIERQAKKAEKYRVAYERMKELDLKLAKYTLNELKDKNSYVSVESESLKKQEAQIGLDMGMLQDEVSRQRENLDNLNVKISDENIRVNAVFSSIDKNNEIVRLNNERVDELSSRKENLIREIGELEKRNSEIKEKIVSVGEEFNLINKEKNSSQFNVNVIEDKLVHVNANIENYKQVILETKSAIMTNLARQSEFKNELDKVSSSLAALGSNKERLADEERFSVKELDKLSISFDEIDQKLDDQKELFENALIKVKILKQDIEKVNNLVQQRAVLIEKLKHKIASASSKLEILKELRDKREGFSEGVKAYIEYAEKDQRIKENFVGIVADIVAPKEGMVTAVENALSEKTQIVVLKTRKAVDEAVNYLKDMKKGRAQFLALEDIISRESDLQDNPCNSRPLINFVNAGEADKSLLTYLLKSSYLADNLDVESCYGRQGLLFVTKDGDIVNDLIITGGSFKEETTSIIGRDVKIRELESDVFAFSEQVTVYETEYKNLNDKLTNLNMELESANQSARHNEILLNNINSQKSNITQTKEKLSEKTALLAAEFDQISKNLELLCSKKQSLINQIDSIDSENKALESLISQNEEMLISKANEKEGIIVELTKLRTETSVINERFDTQKTSLDMLKQALRENTASIALRSEQIKDAEERVVSLKEEADALVNSIATFEQEKKMLNESLRSLSNERDSLAVVFKDLENKLKQKQSSLDNIREQVSKYNVQYTELNYKTQAIYDRIQQAYNVDLGKTEDIDFEDDADWQAICEETSVLKEMIDKMGPVNLVAIDEHKELLQRYDFLTFQHEDLMRSKESLHQAISKINFTTRKLFSETFEQIRTHFNNYFRVLFGGGKAELFLLDETDILESGIDIVVRPPGKKLQNISLLSGGEKALTSIALLFALFKTKPAPFCILDEIDAPLDEANIERFTRIIDEFVKTTQFIIITHNKKTISASDVMYGVTMQKSGISKVVSAKFSKDGSDKEKKFTEEPDVSEESMLNLSPV